jgi:predicted Na+-dependent transporter
MGLSLTTGQIIAPVCIGSLVILAFGVNYILVPIFAYVITVVLPVLETV